MSENSAIDTFGMAGDLSVLGLDDTASWPDVERAYGRLVADLTPGPDANHRNVGLALRMLDEVNQAYRTLRGKRVA